MKYATNQSYVFAAGFWCGCLRAGWSQLCPKSVQRNPRKGYSGSDLMFFTMEILKILDYIMEVMALTRNSEGKIVTLDYSHRSV